MQHARSFGNEVRIRLQAIYVGDSTTGKRRDRPFPVRTMEERSDSGVTVVADNSNWDMASLRSSKQCGNLRAWFTPLSTGDLRGGTGTLHFRHPVWEVLGRKPKDGKVVGRGRNVLR